MSGPAKWPAVPYETGKQVATAFSQFVVLGSRERICCPGPCNESAHYIRMIFYLNLKYTRVHTKNNIHSRLYCALSALGALKNSISLDAAECTLCALCTLRTLCPVCTSSLKRGNINMCNIVHINFVRLYCAHYLLCVLFVLFRHSIYLTELQSLHMIFHIYSLCAL